MIVPKRKRRWGGVDQMVCSLSAKGLTHGEISAHLADIYDAQVLISLTGVSPKPPLMTMR